MLSVCTAYAFIGRLSAAASLALLCALAALVEPVPVQATVQEDQAAAVRAGFSDPAFDAWLDRVKQEAGSRNISENTLDAAFRGVKSCYAGDRA